jgi:hypothetical protein
MEKIKIENNEELEAVINEIIERQKDCMALIMERTTRKKYTMKHLNKLLNNLERDDEVEFAYRIIMVPKDFMQILARIRRKEVKK